MVPYTLENANKELKYTNTDGNNMHSEEDTDKYNMDNRRWNSSICRAKITLRVISMLPYDGDTNIHNTKSPEVLSCCGTILWYCRQNNFNSAKQISAAFIYEL